MLTIQKGNPNFKWIMKQKAYARESEDIIISVTSSGPKDKAVSRSHRTTIHFHNKSKDRVTTTGYVMLGIDGDRLYFSETDSTTGFKISSQGNTDNGTLQVSDDNLLNWAKQRRGAYALHQDSKSGLYYIQAKVIE